MSPKQKSAPVEPTLLHPELDTSKDPEVDHGLGSWVLQLPTGPKQVGTISALEAVELRARNKVLTAIQERIQIAQQEFTLVRNEKSNYMLGLIGRFGLVARDDFEINDETGAVIHKGHFQYVVPQEAPPDPIVETEAPPEPEAEA